MICSVCKLDKDDARFYKHPSIKPDGIRKRCEDCRNVYRTSLHKKNPENRNKPRREYYIMNRDKINKRARDYRKANKDKFKGYSLKKNFGLSIGDFNKLLKEQNNTCAICFNEETLFDSRQKVSRTLAVDHDHKTGRIRGLLCWHCNSGLGKLKDSVDLLQKAIVYLNKHKEEE